MNEIQLSVLDYLRGGSDERETALEMLTERSFFGPATEAESCAAVRDFIDEVRGDGTFCDDGTNRFVAAILGDTPARGPRNDEIVVTLSFELNHASGDTPDNGSLDAVDAVVRKACSVISLLKGESSNGEPWSVGDCQYMEWNWG